MGAVWESYMYRLRRRRLLWRAFRARHQLTGLQNRTDLIAAPDVLGFVTLRNEITRLPYFLRHYRALGISHFLIVDNSSTDGSRELLLEQPDVSLWTTPHSYRASRFGMDWLGWLLMRYGHGHWCLTVDADELLIYPGSETCGLPELTRWLDARGRAAMGAMMLDLYPRGPLGEGKYDPQDPPHRFLRWFDADNYHATRQPGLQNLWLQGGARERVFFADAPMRAPTLNKLPLVKWNRRMTYVNSTHSMLPRALNLAYDGPGDPRMCGVLLHTKFLPGIVEKSIEEQNRREHFRVPENFQDYYHSLTQGPVLWHEGSVELTGFDRLEELGLVTREEPSP